MQGAKKEKPELPQEMQKAKKVNEERLIKALGNLDPTTGLFFDGETKRSVASTKMLEALEEAKQAVLEEAQLRAGRHQKHKELGTKEIDLSCFDE